MSLLADHYRWLDGCRHVSNRGTHLTPGDIVHRGLSEYVEKIPCPNGLPIDTRTPDQVPAWQRRIEKANRDIAAHKRYFDNEDRLIWNAMNDTELEIACVPQAVASNTVESAFGERQKAFLALIEEFEMKLKGKGNI